MTTHEASSSSSSKSKHWNYDVFMSFSGVDTRNGFTGHLHAALTDRGYQAYIDEDDLKSGEEIKEELFRVIEEARISIIVFSKSYADSRWRLDELVKIMECRYKLGRRVLPIFYHVDPSHVRRQDGYLNEAFKKHEEGICEEKDDEERKAKQEKVEQWREALTGAANLSGPYLRDNGREAKLIREIVNKIIPKWLPIVEELHAAKHLVGIYTRIQDIITYLSNGGSDVVRMVGIWGMAGLGKTTAAKAIYNQIHHKFQFKSFLANVSEYDPVNLQVKLVSDILKQTESKITSVHQGISLIKNNLQRRCVLVIIDNVDKVEQLNAIAGDRDWFGPGSRIIITTRDEHLLKQVNMKVDETYPLKEMNEEDALELFSWHAFGNSWPDEGYLKLSKEFVSYCGGLPLALEVLGSSMNERNPTEWRSRLEELKKFLDEEIMKSLKASEEALTHAEGDNKILPFLDKLFGGGTNGSRIGKRVISSTEITKSKSKHWNYDVFLSCSGVDTRNGFTGHLHTALIDRGYQGFMDEDDLERGEEIKEELFRVIEEARMYIVVFSTRYVDSSWCLDELVKIMECRYKLGRRVLPIFYHVDPSYVRKQDGYLAEAFQWHERSIREEKDDKERKAKQERVKQWREALTNAANLFGHHLQYNGDEAKFIRKIVGKIITELPSTKELDVANFRVQDSINHIFDGGTTGRRIGKLVISSTEISKGSNGTIVLEGVYEGRPVAVKRLVLAHHDMAFKEIQNLIASDRRPNIVRLYGVDYDKDFVYISLERCICNLDDLIQICPNSSQNPVAGEEDAKRARIENKVRLKSLKNIMSDVNLWKVDGFPSLQLLKLMRDVVSGLVHLHEMGIIHRDLKPQNVLLIKERTLCAKLSDMGISKRLIGDMSSLGHLATGCGSSGWQAPEQLGHGRQTRAVDMFSLGCLLFYCITGGTHPFGDQLERDINIVRNQMNLSLVEHIPEAADLISRLLNPDPEIRPKASEVLLHPLFWNSETRLSFLRDSSDRVELENRVANSGVLRALESIAPIAFGGKWDEKMEPAFLRDLGHHRRYKFDSVRDLLRVIRNKSNHYRELPKQIQELVGPFPEGFHFYFASRFPRLLIEVYKVVCQNYREEERFRMYFKSNAD